ncbi:uncharacterized protein V6R79_007502 [Siganus canaliculatus]
MSCEYDMLHNIEALQHMTHSSTLVLILDTMKRHHLALVLLVWIPEVLHAQSAALFCAAPKLENGYVVPKRGRYGHGRNLTYACEKGFKPVVEGWWATVTCQNNKWSHEPQCIDEDGCLAPVIPNVEYTVRSAGWYEAGQKIWIKCKAGYRYKGSDATAVCVNGTWTSVPVCEKRTDACGEPPQILHAVIIHQAYQEEFPAESQVQYECEEGYAVEGADDHKKSIHCLYGTWDDVPKCIQ